MLLDYGPMLVLSVVLGCSVFLGISFKMNDRHTEGEQPLPTRADATLKRGAKKEVGPYCTGCGAPCPHCEQEDRW